MLAGVSRGEVLDLFDAATLDEFDNALLSYH
jgi:hypothetical protein